MTEPDPDLAVDADAFEAFAEAVTAAVLGPLLGAPDLPGAPDAPGADAGGPVGAGDGGSVVAGEGGDALYTLPDGSISFSGSTPGGFGDVGISFDAG